MGVFDGNKYDGIESDPDNGNDDIVMITPQTLKKIESYIPLMTKDHPEHIGYLKKQLTLDLTEKDGQALIKRCSEKTGVE